MRKSKYSDFYLGSKDWEYPIWPHLVCRQARRRHFEGRRTGDCARLDFGFDGKAREGQRVSAKTWRWFWGTLD